MSQGRLVREGMTVCVRQFVSWECVRPHNFERLSNNSLSVWTLDSQYWCIINVENRKFWGSCVKMQTVRVNVIMCVVFGLWVRV